MKQKTNAVRVGSSDPNRLADLKANHEKLKEMLANGWHIESAKVRRPRIKEARKPKAVVVTLGGEWTVKLSFEEYQRRGSGLKIVMRIY